MKKFWKLSTILLLSCLVFSCKHNSDSSQDNKKKSVAVPVISPAAGDYIEGFKQISLSSKSEDVEIYYTTDGSDPSNSSCRYTEPFTIYGSKTVKAIAYSGENPSAVVTAIYNMNAGKSASQLGVITGNIALANNLSPGIKEKLADSIVYIYSDELPGVIKQSKVGESFYFDSLDTSKTYSFYFSNKAPGTVISSREAVVQNDSDGNPIVSVKVSDVTPAEGAGMDLATVELKPTGTISGFAYKYDENGEKENDNAGITVFIPGTSFSAFTDKEGAFSMTGVPQGLYTIRAMFSGYTFSEKNNILLTTNSDELPKKSIDDAFDIYYAKGTLKGSVLLSDSSDGNSGVSIIITDVTNSHTYNAATAANGSWAVNDVTPGTYFIEIHKDGYVDQTVNDIIVTGAKLTSVPRIILKENGGSVKGSVIIKDFTDNAGASILAELIEDGETKKTYYSISDSEGSFKFDSIKTGVYTITAVYAGYKCVIVPNVQVMLGETANAGVLTISEKSTYSITGQCVLEGLESGFEGISVLLQSVTDSKNTMSTVTNEEGVYTFTDVAADSYTLTFSKSGFVTNSSVSVNVGMNAVQKVDGIALRTNSGTVSGNIILESAESNEGVSILIYKENDEKQNYTTITDYSGHYAVAGIKPGTYRVQATKGGYNTGISDPFSVSSGVVSSPSDMQLSISLRSAYGKVSLEGKTDYTGVRITATKTTSTKEIYSALSNKEGFYALSGMTPGDYILSYAFEGYRSYTSSSIALSEESSLNVDDVALVKATGKISGIVNLEGCTDHSGIKVSIVGTDYAFETKADGAYEFMVPSGNYPGGVRFEKEDFQLTAKAETIPVLTDSTYGVLTVEMKGIANTLKGITTLAGTDDASGITVTVDGLDPKTFTATTDKDGNWILEHIPLGYQTVRFSKVNVPDVTCEIDVVSCDYIDIGALEMLPDSATLKGNVFLDGMSDNANITITVTTKDKNDVVVRTSSDGAFTATNILASGNHTITFSKDGWVSQSISINDFKPLEERTIGTNREYVLKDTTAPAWNSLPIVINSGANFANNTKLHIDLSPVETGSGIEKMSVQLTRTVAGETSSLYPSSYNWQDYQIGFDFNLADLPDQYVGNGTYTLYIALKDKSGNISEKASKAITITDLVTSLSGVLTGANLHLTEENSPYIVEADCLVSEEDTLIIDPGTEIRFAAKPYEDGNGFRSFSISVSGSICARGTKEKKILFTSDYVNQPYTYKTSEYGEWYDDDGNSQWGYHDVEKTEIKTVYWNGIAINGGSLNTDNIYKYISGNIMEYCEFEYANTPLSVRAGSYINKCKFHDCTNYINIDAYNNNTIIINNEIKDGIRIYQGTHYFVNNKVSGNVNISYTYGLFSNNHFIDSSMDIYGIYGIMQNNKIESSSINLSYPGNLNNNNFVDCSSPIISTTSSYETGRSLNCTGNYWGLAQTQELQSKGNATNISFISDYYDDFNYARIDYSNWATEPFENCGYSETGFVAFDYTVNGYDFSNHDSYNYYPEDTGNILTIALNPQYHENPITQMRIAQNYKELKAANWTTYNSTTSFTVDKSKLVNGAATIYVQIKDSKGNVSSSVVHNIPYDTPVCNLSIQDGASFGGTTKKQEIKYSATDLCNITDYSIELDGNRIDGYSSSWGKHFGDYTYNLPLAYLASGTHTFKMMATDSAGNTGQKTITFTINRSFEESSVKDITYNSTTGQFYKDADTLHLWHLDNDAKEDSGTTEITNYTHTNGGFEGSASSLSGNVPLDLSSNAFTVEFWTRGSGRVSINKESVLEIYNYYGSVSSYNNYMDNYYKTKDGVSSLSVSSSAKKRGDDNWHYWAYVYDGTYSAIYCDGVCVSYQDGFNYTLNTNNNDLSISMSGIVDELRISKIARSADEISSYFKTSKPILDANTGTLEAIAY